MESMLVWIVVFAGAAIALLAVFLVASEKELKKKRLEIDEMLVKLGETPAQNELTMSAATAPEFDSEELNHLRARNQELEKQLASISTSPELNQQFAEEVEQAQRNVEIAKSNAQWLQSANDELKAEIADLKKRLQSTPASVTESTAQFQGSSDREQELENDVADLQQQLAESRAKIRELEGMEYKLANVGVIEATHRQEQQSLEAKIAELERELAADSEKLAEFDSLRRRVAESDKSQQILNDERNRFEQETTRLRSRLTEAEEHSRQLSALRDPFEQLIAKQALLNEHQLEYQKALASFGQMIATAAGSKSTVAFNEFHSEEPGVASPHRSGSKVKQDGDVAAVTPDHIIAANQPAEKPKRTFGIFSLVIILAFAGAVAVGLWSLKTSESSAPATVTASAIPVRSQNQAATPVESNPAPVSQPSVTADAPATKQIAAPAVKEKTEAAKPAQAVKAEKPATGTYEVTQTSRVYAAPSELSQAMGDIEPGIKVDVVNSKNGWLEIHSKHGRPPGFIRKEAARIVAQN